MIERGAPVYRLDERWCGRDMALDTLLKRRMEDLGYTMLCKIENLLEEIDETYTQAIAEAIAEIAYFAGQNRVPVEDVIRMASEINPPPSDREYDWRGINAEKTVAEHRHHVSPFAFLQRPYRGAGMYYDWRFLQCLSLGQLELLTERLQNKVPVHCSTVLRLEPTQR
jgi:hypothetical protein